MKRINKNQLLLFFLVGILIGFLVKQPKPMDLSAIFERHDKEVNEINSQLQNCQAQNESLKSDLELERKFRDERCVCVSWHSSEDEPPMTEEEICNYTPDRPFR